jgi:hypothetical protein
MAIENVIHTNAQLDIMNLDPKNMSLTAIADILMKAIIEG